MSADEVLEHIFTHANPTTGSPRPPHTAWVLFANGTAFYTFPSDTLPVSAGREALVAAANAALDELGPVLAGSPAADFRPGLLDGWFPGRAVYLVSYHVPLVATVYVANAVNDLAAGLLARACREKDFTERNVTVVRDFHGRRL